MMSDRRFWLGWAAALAVVTAVAAWGITQWNLSRYSQLVADRLVLLGELRRGALQGYLDTASSELRFWSTSPGLLEMHGRLVQEWIVDDDAAHALELRRAYIVDNPHPLGQRAELLQATDGNYCLLHAELHQMARQFVTERGYYDFFLIGVDGYINYTVEKEDDFATNLVDGPYSDTALADVFHAAVENPGTVAISDLERYAPSSDAPALFMATALQGDAGEITGVLAFQLPTDRFLDIMNYTSGMGETGETYLVGTDYLMRSNSRFIEQSTVLEQAVNSDTVDLALGGEEGVQYTLDYRDVEVMSAFTSLPVGDTRWALMAEIDREEVVAGAAGERPALAGILALFYGLSLWSIWYWRGRELPDPAGDGIGLSPDTAIGAVDDGGGMGGA
jgi:methyl-accepting chemotaxis protein